MNDAMHGKWKTIKIKADSSMMTEEQVATEFPLTLLVNGAEFATIVCTPDHLREMAIGFLGSEGIIRFFDEIKSIHIDRQQGFAYIELNKSLEAVNFDDTKRFIGSCCGKSRQFYFKSDVKTAKTVYSQLTMTAVQCLALMQQLQRNSDHFKKTGGVHNAALCTQQTMLEIRTDIGRHNALDKLYGYILENKLNVKDKLIAFSGRISSEVLLKVSKMGIGMIISTSAPTDLALNLANDLGITTIGFARQDEMNVYTHPERVTETEECLNESGET